MSIVLILYRSPSIAFKLPKHLLFVKVFLLKLLRISREAAIRAAYS